MPHPDILIIGGGVIGLTTAYFLSREGRRVQVVDRGSLGAEASWAGAGIIPPGNPSHALTAYDELRAVSSRMFPKLTEELRERTGIDNGYRVCGGIEILGRDEEETVAAWRDEQVPFQQIQPYSDSGETAYLLPGMAQVRNPWHLRALITACTPLGVQFQTDATVAQFELERNKIMAARLSTGERIVAGQYLIAAGAWSEALLGPLGLQSGIHPVLGQMVLMKTAIPILRRILLAGKRYIVPREDGHVLIGSTEEPEAGFRKETTTEAIEDLIEFGISLAPALVDAALLNTWAGLRPGSLDGLPSIGLVGHFDNLFLASGHFRAGIQLSPATAQVLCDLLAGRASSISLEDFRPGREPRKPQRMTFRS